MPKEKLRIGEIEVINLCFEYPENLRFRYSGGVCTGRLTSLVRVIAENGLTGWGTAYSYPKLVSIIIEEHLKPFLIGKDLSSLDSLWEQMYKLTRWYGRKGVAISAIGALDIAFWDLHGKMVGKPVYKLLGAERDAVPAYASGLFWQDDVTMLEQEARRHMNHGFYGVKLRLGRGQAYDQAALDAAYSGVGSDGAVMVDGSQRYTMETAEWLGQLLAEKKAVFFQEPFPPEDIDRYVELRQRVHVPLAAGENEFGVQGFRELLQNGALDILQPDVCRAGGITEVWRIATLAHKKNIPIATHTWSDALAIIANAHVVAALPNGMMVEVDQTGNQFVEDLLIEPFCIKNGLLYLPEAPGLGVDIDMNFVDRMRLSEEQGPLDGLYSDLIFGAKYLISPTPYELNLP
jgi:D-galactarolactone cycloisomerase